MRAIVVALLAVAPLAGAHGDLAFRPLPSPAPTGSAQPQLSAARDGTVYLSWLEKAGADAHRFRFSTLGAGQAAWSEPLTIAEGRGFVANWADVPSLAVAEDGLMAAHWMQVSGSGKYAYDVRVSTSADRGRTWSRPFTPHRDGKPAEHGFGSFFRMPGAGLGLVWLDGRTEGQMSLRMARIESAAAGSETLVDDRVCDCCPTTAVQTSRGPIVAYRDRSDDEIRDIYITRLENGRWMPGRAAVRDHWKIAACPVNGPAMAADGDRVVLAWFAAPEGTGRVRVAFSSDAATTFGPAVQVDEGNPLGRAAAVWLPDAAALVGWIEQRQEGAEFLVRRVSQDGTRDPSMKVASLAAGRASGYPRIARSANRVILAWVGNGRVETAIAEP
jgi:hypothetical protein